MKNTERLFYDDEFDALSTAIGNSGKPFKLVAGAMFPDMKPESAYSRLKQCISPTGDQRLTFGQAIRLMNFLECYEPLQYLCDETLHARPARVAPEDQAVELIETIKSAGETMERAMQRLEALKRTAGELRRVA